MDGESKKEFSETNDRKPVEQARTKQDEEEIFEPVLGELVADDEFSFTLLSCHC